jgi:hypothetical protein
MGFDNVRSAALRRTDAMDVSVHSTASRAREATIASSQLPWAGRGGVPKCSV